MRIGSLCTGYGGLDMAVEAYFDATTIWVSEIDKYASQLIEQRIAKPNLGNLKIIDWSSVDEIDILTAGYPCQPFSQAGFRKGEKDERHLWPYIKEAIGHLQPKFVILENVRGHLSLGFKEVLKDLTEIGYDSRWTVVRASDVGAPHRRERIFVVAYPQRTNANGFGFPLGYIEVGEKGYQGQPQLELGELEQTVIPNSHHLRRVGTMQGLQGRHDTCSSLQLLEPSLDSSVELKPHDGKVQRLGRRFTPRCDMHLQVVPNPLDQDDKLNAKFVEYMMGLPDGWVTDIGLSRAQQLKILGNGVVPQQAHYALELLLGRVCHE